MCASCFCIVCFHTEYFYWHETSFILMCLRELLFIVFDYIVLRRSTLYVYCTVSREIELRIIRVFINNIDLLFVAFRLREVAYNCHDWYLAFHFLIAYCFIVVINIIRFYNKLFLNNVIHISYIVTTYFISRKGSRVGADCIYIYSTIW